MASSISAGVALIGALLAVTPLYAQQSGDMFGSGPKLPASQPDMFPSQTPTAPSSDLFHDQSSAPAPDMFPRQAPDAPTADMFDGAAQTANPVTQDRFSAPSAPPTPPYPIFHNPNAGNP